MHVIHFEVVTPANGYRHSAEQALHGMEKRLKEEDMPMPPITIIVPVYKVEAYLRRCVDSILNQTFTDFELIIVDDGSPDGCGKLCDEFIEQDSRILLIHQTNGGLSAARNSGLECAEGKYISFVDSDDSVVSEYLETVLPLMDSGYDLVAFKYQKIFGETSWIQEGKKCIWELNGESRPDFFVKNLLQYKIGWESCTRIFRRSIIENRHLRFADNRIVFAEDLYFSLCYCAYAESVLFLDQVLYNYYIRDNSIVSTENNVLNAGRMNEMGKAVLKQYYNNENCTALIKVFPVIHYYIMDNVIGRFIRKNNVSIRETRALLIEDIKDYDFFAKQMRRLRLHKTEMTSMYSRYCLEELLDIAEYYADGNELLFKIKCKLNDITERLTCRA